jgi:hypothetical protein
MRPGAYGLPNLRRFSLLKLAQISRISQLSAMPLQICSCARSQNNINTAIPRSPTSLSWLKLRAPIGSGTEVYGTCIFSGIARSTPSDRLGVESSVIARFTSRMHVLVQILQY